MNATTDKAVILARGLGTRMRKEDAGAKLDAEQAKIAESGVKAMIPTLGRPFLDFILAGLIDAGYRKVCLVIGPEHKEVREYYSTKINSKKIEVSFVVQEKPLGTGNAIRPAEQFAAGEPFLMINSDNYYPVSAYRQLAQTASPAIAVFESKSMIAGSNIPADRISKFSAVRVNPDGTMKQIIEKPDEVTLASMTDGVFVSMNCWLFSQNIFKAAATIPLSPRGEYEITDAAQYCIDHLNEKYQVVKFHEPVLDLSSRSDIQPVNDMLRKVVVDL